MSHEPDSRTTEARHALEVAHVLFADIVGYSLLPLDQQQQTLWHLQEAVRTTAEFARAQSGDQLISLPTGDGMALVFLGDVEAPVRCALELTQALRAWPNVRVRIGIHSGPVYQVQDINAARNVAGSGINIAQRVMDCGDAGHILVSKAVADMLGQVTTWKTTLHDLGEAEVKHGVRVHLYNFYGQGVGNPELPQKLRITRRTDAQKKPRFARRRLGLVIAVMTIIVLCIAAGILLRAHQSRSLTDKDTIVIGDFVNNTGDPIFNDTLKQGLSVELEQSPFLNILDERKLTEVLGYMGRPADEPLTQAVALEVCQRSSSKVVLLGSISSMGSRYVVGLKAMNCQSEDSIGNEQVEVDKREEVLAKLHEIGQKMRARLGETMSSIQNFDVPLQRATTSSLEALQDYSRATKAWNLKGESAAAPLYKYAIQLDPDFASAYADLAVIYSNLNEFGLSADNAQKAYKLRDRATQRERFIIDSVYYLYGTGEQDKAAQIYDQWKQIYPRDLAPYIQVGLIDTNLGMLDRALRNDQDALKLTAEKATVYSNLAYDYMYLNMPDQASAILQQARNKAVGSSYLQNYYQLAFLRNDVSAMQRCVANAAGKPEDEDALLALDSDTEAFHGRLKTARRLSKRAIDTAVAAGAKEVAAGWQASAAMREVEFGNFEEASQEASEALKLAANRELDVSTAMVFARAGDLKRTQRQIDRLNKRVPPDTLLKVYWLPAIKAAIALRQNRPEEAIQFLEVTSPYELGGAPPPFSSGGTMYPVYLRGQAYMAAKRWPEAANEFQRIVDHRGLVWNSPLAALAYVQLARVYAASGDSRARMAYEQVFSIWHDADPDLGILHAVQKEFADLK